MAGRVCPHETPSCPPQCIYKDRLFHASCYDSKDMALWWAYQIAVYDPDTWDRLREKPPKKTAHEITWHVKKPSGMWICLACSKDFGPRDPQYWREYTVGPICIKCMAEIIVGEGLDLE